MTGRGEPGATLEPEALLASSLASTWRYQMADNSGSGGIGLLGVVIGAVIVVALGMFFLGGFQGNAPTTKVSIEAPKVPAGK
jgi:hypothetical protein